jgi:hypothetical protein
MVSASVHRDFVEGLGMPDAAVLTGPILRGHGALARGRQRLPITANRLLLARSSLICSSCANVAGSGTLPLASAIMSPSEQVAPVAPKPVSKA